MHTSAMIENYQPIRTTWKKNFLQHNKKHESFKEAYTDWLNSTRKKIGFVRRGLCLKNPLFIQPKWQQKTLPWLVPSMEEQQKEIQYTELYKNITGKKLWGEKGIEVL